MFVFVQGPSNALLSGPLLPARDESLLIPITEGNSCGNPDGETRAIFSHFAPYSLEVDSLDSSPGSTR